MKQFDLTITRPHIYKVKINAETFEDAEKFVRDQYERGINVHAFRYSDTEGPMTITENGETALVPKAYKVKIIRELEDVVRVVADNEKQAIEKGMILGMTMRNEDLLEGETRAEIAEVIYEEVKDALSGKETNKD